MVQIRSRLDVADNTGARMATMIGVIGKQTRYAGIGDVITSINGHDLGGNDYDRMLEMYTKLKSARSLSWVAITTLSMN